jgi:AmiR/NasT family two-component response regulator
VGDIDPALVKPVIDVAMAQFRSFQRLRDELTSRAPNWRNAR